MISVKAKHQTEIRRFALPANSLFSTLSTTLSNLFSISDPLVIKYLDDENDLCTISTQEELNFATSMLNKGPLRIQVFVAGKTEEPPKPVSQLSASTPAFHFPAPQSTWSGHSPHSFHPSPFSHHQEPNHPHLPPNHPYNNRHWGHHHHGGEGRPERPRMTKCERMEAKEKSLQEKQQFLIAQLADESLNSERRRVLNWKLQKLEEKVKFLEARKEHAAQEPNSGRHGRGGGGRGRGCWGEQHQVAQQGSGMDQPKGQVAAPGSAGSAECSPASLTPVKSETI